MLSRVLGIVCFAMCAVAARGWWKTTQPDAARGAWISGEAAPVVSGPRLAEQDIAREPPFVGDFGFDVDGYAKQRPDRVQLLNLLRLGRYDTLDKFLGYYEDEFDRDFRKETWPSAALGAFDVSDPALGPLLDQWVEQRPNSFAAYAARGEYRVALGWHYRGHDLAKETSFRQFLSFEEYLAAARTDFLTARKLRPHSVALFERLMHVAMTYQPPEERNRNPIDGMAALMREALRSCPLCFNVRAAFLHALRPRWFGSYRAMEAYVESTKPLWSQNGRLRLLAGLPDSEFCHDAWNRNELNEARIACERSLRFGDWTWTLHQAARLANARRDDKLARTLADRTLAIDPQDRDALGIRADVSGRAERYEDAAQDVLLARQLDPTDPDLAEQVRWLVDKLRYDGDQARIAKRARDATRMFSLALKLAPDDRDLRLRLGHTEKTQDLTPASIAAQLAAAPDDFALRLRLDSGLAASLRFPEIVTMWDAFIATHPSDPRAYSERGGAKWQQRLYDAAMVDMEHACELGMQKACGDLAQMKARAGR